MTRLLGLGLVVCAATSIGWFVANKSPQAGERKGETAEYHNYDAMTAQLRELAGGGSHASLASIGKSSGGRDIWMLRLAEAGSLPDQRPALLLVGGIDADDAGSSEIALETARGLLKAAVMEQSSSAAKLLRDRTIYIIPRANPDGVEWYFQPVRREARGNGRTIDDDRDLAIDEDGPDDLNGDGVISVMRVPDAGGEWMVDPDQPRLMKKADRSKGEHGTYRLVLEGIDNDADGEINEDGPDGVDNDRNWPHLFEAGATPAGKHQLCEPENRALADFVLAHPNISTALVYGRNDNVQTVPKGKDRGPDGQSYRDLHPDDVKVYEFVSAKLKKTAGLNGSPGCRPDGAFYSWLYAHRGIPSFAVHPWWPIEGDKDAAASQPSSQPASQSQPAAQEGEEQRGSDAEPGGGGPPGREEARGRFRRQAGDRPPPRGEARGAPQQARPGGGEGGGGRGRGARGGRGGGGGFPAGGGPGGGGPGGPPGEAAAAAPIVDGPARFVESSENAKKWLKYSDEKRDGGGFVAWKEFVHPTLGKVEIGGFAPYFVTNPPAGEIEGIAGKQVEFVIELASLLPSPGFARPKVRLAGADLWDVELRMRNDGYLATHLAVARQIQLPAWVVRPIFPVERVLGGRKAERIENLDGSGGQASVRWLVRGQQGDSVEFAASNRRFGEIKTKVELRETSPGEENQP